MSDNLPWGYEIYVIANRPYASKVIGTNLTSNLLNETIECQKEQPSLFFYTPEDAASYKEKLDPRIKDTFNIYRAVINIEKTSHRR